MVPKREMQIVLEVIAGAMKEELDKIGTPDWQDPNFSAVARLNGLTQFIENKAKEYSE